MTMVEASKIRQIAQINRNNGSAFNLVPPLIRMCCAVF